MKNHSPLPSRPFFRSPRSRRRRGFSLVEVMVVVLILGLIAVMGGGEIARAWKRQKLQSASGDVRVLFQRAYSEVFRRGTAVFIQVGPLVTAGASRSAGPSSSPWGGGRAFVSPRMAKNSPAHFPTTVRTNSTRPPKRRF